jgi:MFS family permease
MTESHKGQRFSAFRHRSYRLFFMARFLAAFATQIISVSVGWQMYDLTHSPIYLGLIGLVQFLPSLLLILVTGSVADRFNRRVIVGLCLIVSSLCAAALLGLTVSGTFAPLPVFAILLVFGIERAFMGPAVQSLAPNLVPTEDLANSFAWNSSSWQTASIVGPVAGGLLYGVNPVLAYSVAVAFMCAGAVCVFLIPKPAQHSVSEARTWSSILAGFTFIRREPVVLGAISLDLFAVLLGGATALMAIFSCLAPGALGFCAQHRGSGRLAWPCCSPGFRFATDPV